MKKKKCFTKYIQNIQKVRYTMYYITYDNETVVYDSNKKRLVSVPTEQEAIEYINDFSALTKV